MTRRRRWLLLAGGVGTAGVVVVVAALLYLPMAGPVAGYQEIGLRMYSYESVSLFGNVPAWQNYSYRGVTFEFHLWCGITPAGGTICGNATQPDGAETPYSFWDGLNSGWQTWVSPDGYDAVQYHVGGTAHLLVQD